MKIKTILLIILTTFAYAQKNNYKITVELNGFPDKECILAHHYGDKKYVDDTAQVRNNKCIFAGTDTLEKGVYMLVLPPKNIYFEFIITEKDKFFTLKSDTSDFIKNMKVSGSEENKVFYDYVRFAAERGKVIQELSRELSEAKTKEDSGKIQEKIKAETRKLEDYKKQIIEKKSHLFWAKVLKMMQEPEVPEAIRDSQPQAYYYFKQHYLDYIDFNDPGLIRTPVFWNKINFYLEKLTPPHPDSVVVAVKTLLEKAKANDEMLRFLMIKLLNKYATSKVMGMDKVYVFIVRNYYEKGYATWIDSVQLFKIIDRANKIEPNLIGKKGANIVLPDSSGKLHSMYALPNKYTILYIWDPDCGHCKKETPKLKKGLEELKKEGIDVAVFGVYGGVETEKWKEYIRNNKLPWINVHDPEFQSDYRWKYDVYSTPTIYLLDKDKKIIAKRLGVKELIDYIRHLEERDKEKQ